MTRKQKKMLLRIIIAAVATVLLLIVALDGYIGFALWIAVYLLIGYDILWRAVRGIFSGQIFDENFLMAIATVGAIIIAAWGKGDLVEAVAVMLFYQTGELFQSYAVGKSRKSIGALMDIRPDKVNIECDGKLCQVSPDEVEVGSEIVVCAGERIAIDGIVTQGESVLDTFALTGESVPRRVNVGDEVLSGCINTSGTLKIRTQKEFGESTVSKILEMVESASSRKAVSERFITKFAKYYTPIVCVCALLLAVVPPLVSLVFGIDPMWQDWIYRALTFLVISCPCALVISIPLSFFAGLGGASRQGILIKGSNFIEALSKVRCVALDKTGTLTEGSFEVREVTAVDGDSEKLLEYAALAEADSSHPIAKSLVAAYKKEIDRKRISRVEELKGKGACAKVDGAWVAVGNRALMEEQGIDAPTIESSATTVYVAIDGKYSGYILIADKIKDSSVKAVADLRGAGVKRVVMLTGDRAEVAKDIGTRARVDEVHSELLPDEKVKALEALLSDKHKTAFVGDGINDAPVLSRADVGIAMGGIGSDAAIEAADAVIMDDDPEKIAKAIKLSKRCMRIVYQNIVLTMLVKGVCLLLGAFGVANMWLAIFADVGVMVLAVLNSIRAMSSKRI